MRIWKIPDQVLRLAIVAIVLLAVTLVVRQRFIPETFGEIGHYRASAIETNARVPIRYAGLAACAECHVDEAETKSQSYHRGLSCEGCHGASADHTEDPTEVHPVVPRDRKACLRCHDYRPTRPTGFPQIIETVHNPMEPCAGCHDPHDPTPPMTPGSCSACHGEIARTKSVSHHRNVDCRTCHASPPGHLVNPRTALPNKPTAREFCGKCHAAGDGKTSGAHQVDLASHGGRYLCWQCHYPHHPEGK